MYKITKFMTQVEIKHVKSIRSFGNVLSNRVVEIALRLQE